MEQGAGAGQAIIGSLLPLYRDPNFAYAVASGMVAVAVLLIAIAILRHVATISALTRRWAQINNFVSFGGGAASNGADPQEEQFASRFVAIDAAMSQRGLFMGDLVRAWRRYRKTLTFLDAPPVRSTQHPGWFFHAALRPQSWLGFAAGIFVGFGLLATFVGLVAALTFATEGMKSADSGAMQAAIRDLLGAASSKFVTSIAGVGLSIVLSLVERVLTANLRGQIDGLASALELGIRVDSDAHSAAVAQRMSHLIETIERSLGSPRQGSVDEK